jgi:very-short-patch-repair endonuclease
MNHRLTTSHTSARERILAARAHGLRHAPTLSEAKLWAELSGGKLGVAFRRQVLVGHRFIVDFLAPSLKVVVEVDGCAHEHRRHWDAWRDEKLRRLGYRVLRIEAELVMRKPAAAVALVMAEVERARR